MSGLNITREPLSVKVTPTVHAAPTTTMRLTVRRVRHAVCWPRSAHLNLRAVLHIRELLHIREILHPRAQTTTLQTPSRAANSVSADFSAL